MTRSTGIFISVISSIIILTCCIKVKRNYNVELPARASAVQRSQNAVFEIRNSVLVQVPLTEINNLLEDVRKDLSGKEFVDTKSAEPKSSPFLGGTLESSIGKSVVRICMDKISLRTDGPAAMKLALTISSCGLNVDIFNARAALRAQGKLASKPIKISVDHFTAKKTDDVQEFTLKFQLQTDDLGALQFAPEASLEGLNDLSDPNSYNFQAENSMDSDTLGSFDKTADQMSTQILTQLLKVFHVFLANSMSDAFSRSFKRISEKFNERNIGLKTRSWSAGFGDLSLFSLVSLNGIVGDKSLTAVFNSEIHPIGDALALTKHCHVDQFGLFPDAVPNWLRGLPLEPYLNNAVVADGSQIVIPVQTVNYLFWKIFGNKGTCNWKYADGDSGPLSVRAEYQSQWRINFLPKANQKPNRSADGSFDISTIVLQIPSFHFLADIPIMDKVLKGLKDSGFVNNPDELKQIDYTLGSFDYPLQIIVDRAKSFLRFAVPNEAAYLAKSNPGIQDLVEDTIDQLRAENYFSSATIAEKKQILIKAVVTTVLNHYLARHLHDAQLTLRNALNQTQLFAQTITVNEKSIQIALKGDLGKTATNQSPSKLEKDMDSLTTNRMFSLSDPVQPEGATLSEAVTALKNLGIPMVIDIQSGAGLAVIQSTASDKGFSCAASQRISLPIDENSSTIASYVSCFDPTTSIEYRIHTEKASLVNGSPESPILFLNIRYHRLLAGLDSAKISNSSVPEFDGLSSALRKPSSDLVQDQFFVTNWIAEKLHVSAFGFCSKKIVDSKCDNANRVITGIKLWQN